MKKTLNIEISLNKKDTDERIKKLILNILEVSGDNFFSVEAARIDN